MAALSKQIHQPLGPSETEAKAMEIGVLFSWDVGIREVIFECDSKIVSNALLRLRTLPMIISNILAGVYNQLQNFSVVQVSYVMCINLIREHQTRSWSHIQGSLPLYQHPKQMKPQPPQLWPQFPKVLVAIELVCLKLLPHYT